MAKSMSFNKRELEKKKEQKKQEKLKRKEERKANNGVESFDDMIAYVDENGVITNTPPDPERKTKVEAENIAVSTPKKEETEDPILTGRVEHFNQDKGYGFIKDTVSAEKYFFHISNAPANIAEGDMVVFELERGQKGMNAVRIAFEKTEKTD
ncbi:MAG: cold shock domain-containing protein [Bacteroidota bacterium]|nr:cold shock domain-containing protein [Bacteroidota bacterium]